MKIKYVSIDCGKANTKACSYDVQSSDVSKTIVSTNVEKRNSLVELCRQENQYIVAFDGDDEEINGGWDVGFGSGQTSYSNSKKDMIHKIMTLTAIALVTENGDTVVPAIGCPLTVFNDADSKVEFYDYIFPDGRVDVNINGIDHYYFIKKDKGCVFPESFGAMFMFPERFTGDTGVIDIGGLNVNASLFKKGKYQQELSMTEKLGLLSIVSYLRTRLNALCDAGFDDRTVESFIRSGSVPGSDKSAEVIESVLASHLPRIEMIVKEWNIDRIDLIFIGGTSKILQKYIEERFLDKAFIPDEADFINCKGFLKEMLILAGYNCPF